MATDGDLAAYAEFTREIARKLAADLGPDHVLTIEFGTRRRPRRLERIDGGSWQGVIRVDEDVPPRGFRWVQDPIARDVIDVPLGTLWKRG